MVSVKKLEMVALVLVLAAMIASGSYLAQALLNRGNDGFTVEPAVEAAQTAEEFIQMPWPELAETDRARALAIALADPEVQELLQGKGYEVAEMWPMDAPPKDMPGGPTGVPMEPYAEAWMNLRLDKVYQIEHDWPWMPDNHWRDAVELWPRHLNMAVRTMCITVSLEEGRVTGICPTIQAHDLYYWVGPPSILENTTPAPLTQEEKSLAKDMALADPRVQELIRDKSYAVVSAGLSHAGARKLGAMVAIDLGELYQIEYDWPVAEYHEDEEGQPYFTEYTFHNALPVRTLLITVNFGQQKVISIHTADRAMPRYVTGPHRS